jgi:hypothetical protein
LLLKTCINWRRSNFLKLVLTLYQARKKEMEFKQIAKAQPQRGMRIAGHNSSVRPHQGGAGTLSDSEHPLP